MNKPCARCNKTVYPTEKLACLDKIWHKGCFKCDSCDMTLNMKNYKGYKKIPYCNAHYPSIKATTVADTPENRRLEKNTQNQSTLKYHENHEKEKGKYTAVTDDPESLRIKKTQTNTSNVQYHADFEREKSKFTTVTDDPESRRIQKSQIQTSDVLYKGQAPAGASQYVPAESGHLLEGRRPSASAAAPAAAQPAAYTAPPPQAAPPQSQGPRYEAIYDYTAADDDEVSFVEGDIVLNAEIIDEGWMTGTIERTGQTGMLPSNYVEQV